jgi:galactonate dehydratase
MTAISGVEIAMWDLIGKATGQPVYRLIGGRYHNEIPSYANGWYGGAATPQEFAERAKDVVRRGYRAMKFDPFRTAWMQLAREDAEFAVDCVAAVREAVGPQVDLILEVHGRLAESCVVDILRRLERFRLWWCEEPVNPEKLELCAEVRRRTTTPISCGERLYNLAEFERLFALRGCDIVQPDIAHCGGLHVAKKIAALAAVRDISLAPHVSIGPVALAAALHFDVSTPNFLIQESFAEFDVPWRADLVSGWNPVRNGGLVLSDAPGLGIELDDDAIASHPYVKNPFPSLWDANWASNFTQHDRTSNPSE